MHVVPRYEKCSCRFMATAFFYCRVVSVSEAQEVSLNQNCQFLEVSAAESYSGVQLAFHSLLKETRSSQLHRNLPVRRKLGVNSVSKVHHLLPQSLRSSSCFNLYFYGFHYRPWEIFSARTTARQIERGHRWAYENFPFVNFSVNTLVVKIRCILRNKSLFLCVNFTRFCKLSNFVTFCCILEEFRWFFWKIVPILNDNKMPFTLGLFKFPFWHRSTFFIVSNVTLTLFFFAKLPEPL